MNIQMREILMHLRVNGKGPKDQLEMLRWISSYGPTFRAYLNSIKLVFLTWHCMGKDFGDITWDDYCSILARLNEVKDVCIDTIVVEPEFKPQFKFASAV
jgi:hypothetical protein